MKKGVTYSGTAQLTCDRSANSCAYCSGSKSCNARKHSLLAKGTPVDLIRIFNQVAVLYILISKIIGSGHDCSAHRGY